MASGVVVGIVWPNTGAAMQPLGDTFIKGIRVLIAPIIFCTVVHGIASTGDMAKVGVIAVIAYALTGMVSSYTIDQAKGGEDRDDRKTHWRSHTFADRACC